MLRSVEHLSEKIAIATITDNRHNHATGVMRRDTQSAARTETTKDTFQLR